LRDFFPLFILFYCTPTRRAFASKGLVKTPAKGKDPKNKEKLFHQKKSKISQIFFALFIALSSSLVSLCIPGAAVCDGDISVALSDLNLSESDDASTNISENTGSAATSSNVSESTASSYSITLASHTVVNSLSAAESNTPESTVGDSAIRSVDPIAGETSEGASTIVSDGSLQDRRESTLINGSNWAGILPENSPRYVDPTLYSGQGNGTHFLGIDQLKTIWVENKSNRN